MSTEERIKTRIAQISKSACIGEPVSNGFLVEGGKFVLTVKKVRGEINRKTLEAFGVPTDAEMTLREEDAVYRWASHADAIFEPGGILNQSFGDAYEMRTAQLYGARLVQRAIEMKEQVVIEAPTGTGKSMLSLAVAVRMGLTVVISTSNKALQNQLYFKDAPFLLETLNPLGGVVLVQGKSNYICRRDAFIGANTLDEDGDEDGNFSYVKAKALNSGNRELDSEFAEWITTTKTGNLTDADFEVSDKQKRGFVVNDSCDGKKCDHYKSCYYYEMKRRRESAQIVICNHALLALDTLYPNAGILPHTQILVIDEAHKLTSFVRNALSRDFSLPNLIDRVINVFDTFGFGTHRMLAEVTMSAIRDEIKVIDTKLRKISYGRNERDIPMMSRSFKSAAPDMLLSAADDVWGDDDAEQEFDKDRAKAAKQLRTAADNLARFCAHDEGDVRWLSFERDEDSGRYQYDEKTRFNMAPIDVSWVVRQIAGVSVSVDVPEVVEHDPTRCHRCNRELTSATVHVLNGYPYGPKCIDLVDPVGDAEIVSLEDWTTNPSKPEVETPTRCERSSRATVFQSATLAVSNSFEKMMREWGVRASTTFVAESPFPFEQNCRMLIPSGTTPAKQDLEEIVEFMSSRIRELVRISAGGAFVLFTANARLHACKDELRDEFEKVGYEVLVQGETGKKKIAERFKENPHCVLFATRTFFEGIDISGDNLRLVVLDAMPFTPPSPIGKAIQRKYQDDIREMRRLPDGSKMSADRAKWIAYDDIVVPEMIIDFKQAFGRLIRTVDDRGVFAILDTAARTKKYGKRAVGELPAMEMVFAASEVKDMFTQFELNGGSDTENWMDFISA